MPRTVAASLQKSGDLVGVQAAGVVLVLHLSVGGGVAASQDGKLLVKVEGGADSPAIAPSEKGAGQAEAVPD
jgi:hypothetical protein